MKKLAVIDFLKGYSIFTIILFHCFQNLNLTGILSKAIQFGGTGVHLFIFLSGFGLYSSHLRKRITFSEFTYKRLGKVYIPYILIVLLSAGISLFIPIYKNSYYALAGHIFFYKMFDENIVDSYGYQLWFISTIMQFYLSFYLLILIKDKLRNNIFLITCVSISLSWSLLIVLTKHTEMRIWNSFFLQYLWEFALGMIVAEGANKHVYNLNMKNVYYLIIGLIFTAIFGVLSLNGGEIGKVFNDIPALIGYSFLAIFIYKLNIRQIKSFFIFTGKISYSLYLVHILIVLLIKYICDFYNLSFSYLAVIAILLFSYIIAKFYDKLISQTSKFV